MTGLTALPLFLSLRAAIRAKVEAADAERLEGEKRDEARALARRYFDCAVQFLAYGPPRLVAIGGLSGVGKSALAGALAPEIGRAPGALWLRSDLERKVMFAVEETVRLPASAYAGDVTRDVYERLIDKARTALRAGQSVLLDATFAAAAERSAAAGVATEVGVAFAGLFLDAPLATRLERIGFPARRRFRRRRRCGAPTDGGASGRERMGGVGGLGELERHDGPRAGAARRRVTRATPATGCGPCRSIADHKMFMFGSVEMRHEEE